MDVSGNGAQEDEESTSGDRTSLIKVQQILSRLVQQLSQGCGDSDCQNEHCVSSGRREPAANMNEATATAISIMVKHGNRALCGGQQLSKNESKSLTSTEKNRSATADAAASSSSTNSNTADPIPSLTLARIEACTPEQLNAWLPQVFGSLTCLARSFPLNDNEDQGNDDTVTTVSPPPPVTTTGKCENSDTTNNGGAGLTSGQPMDTHEKHQKLQLGSKTSKTPSYPSKTPAVSASTIGNLKGQSSADQLMGSPSASSSASAGPSSSSAAASSSFINWDHHNFVPPSGWPPESSSDDLSYDVTEARIALGKLFPLTARPPYVETVNASLSRIAQDGIPNLYRVCPQILTAFALIMDMNIIHDMDFPFDVIMKAANRLPDIAKVRLVKFWSGMGADWLLDKIEAIQQQLTIHLVSFPHSKNNPVNKDSRSINSVMFLQLFYLASLYGGDRDPPKRLKDEEKFYADNEEEIQTFLKLAKERESEERMFRSETGDEDDWMRIESSLQKSLSLHVADVHRPLVENLHFHNETLSQLLQPDKDFLNFKAREPDRFAFVSYPFVLLPSIKMEEMFFDNRVEMHRQRRRAFMNTQFNLGTHEYSYLYLHISRRDAVRDALGQLDLVMKETPRDLKKQLRIIFEGEEGVDEGGPSKEFYQIITKQLFDQDYGMFVFKEDQRLYWFNGESHGTEEEFTLIGMLYGLAIYNSLIVDVHMPTFVYYKLAGKLAAFRHLKQLDQTLYNSLQSMLDYEEEDFEDVFCATFEIAYKNVFGETVHHALCPDGANVPVTKLNRKEYVEAYAHYLLNESVSVQFNAFRKGFKIVTYQSALESLFSPDEVELLVCGTKSFDLLSLKSTTVYDSGYEENSQVITWFWEVLESMSEKEQRSFLAFSTGSDRVPLGGMSQIKFIVARNGDDNKRLPSAHTCFNVLLLPEYSTKEILQERLLKAILNYRGFGLQ